MGLISLLLTIGQEPISRICVNKSVGDSFLPCQDISDSRPLVASATQISGSNATYAGEEVDVSSCEAKVIIRIRTSDNLMFIILHSEENMSKIGCVFLVGRGRFRSSQRMGSISSTYSSLFSPFFMFYTAS